MGSSPTARTILISSTNRTKVHGHNSPVFGVMVAVYFIIAIAACHNGVMIVPSETIKLRPYV